RTRRQVARGRPAVVAAGRDPPAANGDRVPERLCGGGGTQGRGGHAVERGHRGALPDLRRGHAHPRPQEPRADVQAPARMMRIGVSEQSARKVSDPRQGARFMIERAAAARRAGLDSLFVGDHHATPGQYYQNVPITARMLAEWGDAPAGCLFLLPLWNPVLLAEQVGTLAAIASGRFIIQAGLGDDESQFAAMGTTLKTRPSAFEESLDIVRPLLKGGVGSSSRRFRFRDARVALRPAGA